MLLMLLSFLLVSAADSARSPEDVCRYRLRELCPATKMASCVACAEKPDNAAALLTAGCSVARLDGLCHQAKVTVAVVPTAAVPRPMVPASMRAGIASCEDGGGQCELAPLVDGESLCLESSSNTMQNYFLTSAAMLTRSGGFVFPVTRMLQLRYELGGSAQEGTLLHWSAFQDFTEGAQPGGNLTDWTLDPRPTTSQVSDGGQLQAGPWVITPIGMCEVAVADPTFSCDSELAACVKDKQPIPGGERNRTACEAGCARVNPCAANFTYQNVTDIWRNIHNKGDGPPDPDGRGCSRGFCYGTDQPDSDVVSRCTKTSSAGTGVGGGNWYRFVGEDNTGMATAPVSSDHCGTAWPGWLSGWGDINTIGPPPRGYNEPGRYPLEGEGIIDGTACFTRNCDAVGGTRALPVATVRCAGPGGADYLLWKLEYTGCASAYCTDRHTMREGPCESGDYITLDQPWRNAENERGSEPYNGQGPDGAYGADIAGLGKPLGECSSAHLYSRTNVGDHRWCVCPCPKPV